MAAAYVLLAALLFRFCLWAEDGKDQPSFSSDSIVNSANNSPASLTPNGLATLYGTNLAFATGVVSLEAVGAGTLPSTLAGVRIFVRNLSAPLLYVSSTQINFLIPGDLLPGGAELRLDRQGTGAVAQLVLREAAPALFVVEGGGIAATHADGSLIASNAPARPGEVIVVYGSGLGRTDPKQVDGRIPRFAAKIVLLDRLRILLDGETLPDGSIQYAGITPGYPGLYQINLRLPGRIAKGELRVAVDDQMSQSALLLPIVPSDP